MVSGITHVVRHLTTLPVYVDRAQGTRKGTVDGWVTARFALATSIRRS